MNAPSLRNGSVPDRVLVIHAHPDDEVFATAAATIALAEQGYQILLRVGTGGEGGLPAHAGDPARARNARAAQLTRSCRLLGIADWDYLAEAGRWIDTGCGGAQTLADEEPRVLAAAVRDCIDRVEPTVLLTVDHVGLTGHPDHIAIHNAVRGALAAPGWRPREAWGALLLRRHIVAAHALARDVIPHRSVGSGRVRGHPDDVVERLITCSPEDAGRRRAALDEYTPGLGTLPHTELAQRLDRFGDSLLLRLAMDASDWHTDRFARIHADNRTRTALIR
ncbi:PIG-L family deacetylase [Virgisporangium aurantiacum]|nr:PIG-L family deacetylase [Virgisporangium aurantiacum]